MPEHMIPAIYLKPDLFKHYGKTYTVTPIKFAGSTPQITALASGDIDIATLSPSAFVAAVTNAKLDLVAIGDVIQDGQPDHYSQSIYVKTDSGINSVKDLKGKTVGVNAIGSAVDTAVRVMLAKNGMDPKKDIRVVEASFANMLPMLSDGKIDAGPIQEPVAGELVKAGKYRLLFTSQDAIGPTQFIFLAARRKFLDANKSAMLDFFEDYARAIRWFTDPKNKDEAVALVAKASIRPPETLSYIFGPRDYYRDPFMMPDADGIQRAITIASELGLVPKAITVSPDYVDLSFAEEAKKRISANP